VAAPIASAGPLSSPANTLVAICTRSLTGPARSIEMPNIFGSWPMSTVSAMPFM